MPQPKKKGFFSKYDNGAEFDKCDVEGVSNTWYLVIKALFAMLICTNVLVTYLMNIDGLGHMFYFFSYWGDVATLFAVIFQIKAAENKKAFQAPAMICSEMAICYNVVITPLFWTILAPYYFTHIHWHGMDIVVLLHLVFTHTLPIIASIVTTYLTKGMIFFPEDWKIMFVSGIVYIYANWLGTQNEGKPMYPIADWSSYPETIFLYFLLGCVHSFLYYHIAKWVSRQRGVKA